VDRVSLVEGDTALTPDQGSTGGSTGLTRGGVEVRRAAATAREVLLRIASQRLQVPADQLALYRGKIGRSDAGDFNGNTGEPPRELPVDALLS
jgi:nicotinate dehydrogenase subunit B